MLSGLHAAVGIGAGSQGMSPMSGVSKISGLARLPLGKCTGLVQDPFGWQVDMTVNDSPAVVFQEEHLVEGKVKLVTNIVTYEV